MNPLLESLLKAQGGHAVGQMANRFGLNPSQASDVIGQLAPALGRGLQRNATSEGGLADLIGALQRGNHARYVEAPEAIERPETVDDGNAILGHIFGNKEVSRKVAARASEQTGVSDSIIKKMLPIIAAMAMGALSKKTSGGGTDIFGSALGGGAPSAGAGAASGGGLGDLLGGFLDADQDGSIVDDLLGMAGRFLR